MKAWRRYLRFWRDDVDADVDDELRFHFEQRVEDYVKSGLTREQAEAATRQRLGDLAVVEDTLKAHDRERARRASWIERLDRWRAGVRVAVRSLRRTPAFAATAILTVALATAATCVVGTVVNAVLLRPLPYANSNRLIGLWHTMPGIHVDVAEQAIGTYIAYRDGARSLESVGAYDDNVSTITLPDPTLPRQRTHVAQITASLLPTLGVHPALGRELTAADEQPKAPMVAFLSNEFWRSSFHGDARAIGKVIQMDGQPALIIGVLPRNFAFPASDVRIWVQARIQPGAYLGSFNFRAIGRLEPGVSLEQAQRELQQLLLHTPERWPLAAPGITTASALAKTRLEVVVHWLRDDAVGDFGRILWLVGTTCLVLLLVALSNLASLALARSDARRREIAVRAMLGASPAQTFAAIWTELLAISTSGAIVGAAIALGALKLLTSLGPTAMPNPMTASGGHVAIPRLDEVHPDATFVAIGIACCVLFCVVGAVVAAWPSSRSALANGLSWNDRAGTASKMSQRTRAVFVGAEVALALMLLSASAVLGRSVLRLRATSTGFAPGRVQTFRTVLDRQNRREAVAFFRAAQQAVAALPGVESVGITSLLPFAKGYRGSLTMFVEDQPSANGELPPVIQNVGVSGGYFSALGVPFIAGHTFDDNAVRMGQHEAVIGRSLAFRFWHDSTGRRALGRRMHSGYESDWFTIVGIVADVRDTSLTAAPSEIYYVPSDPGADTSFAWPRGLTEMAFVVRLEPGALLPLASVQSAIGGVSAHAVVYDLASMPERMSWARERLDLALLLLGIGASITMLLGIVGLYGVTAYVVGLRTREIGIRIALGWLPERAMLAILVQSEAIVIAGAVVGVLAFAFFGRLLQHFAYGVGVFDAASLAIATMLVVSVATAAAALPARRAARIDPADALRTD